MAMGKDTDGIRYMAQKTQKWVEWLGQIELGWVICLSLNSNSLAVQVKLGVQYNISKLEILKYLSNEGIGSG